MRTHPISRRRLLVGATSLASFATVALPRQILAQDGPLIIGKLFIASGLDPAEGTAGWALVSHGLAETLFTVDRSGRVVPQLAMAASREDATSWTVSLTPGRRFSDGSQVTAHEVAAALTRNVERNPVTRASAGRLAFSAVNDLTLRTATERPTPVLASVLAEWPFAVARLGPGGPVFTGPYRVSSFDPGRRLVLAANAHWPGPAGPMLTILRFQDGQALALAFRSGEVDLAFNLPVESLSMVRKEGERTVKSFPVAYQYMAFLNARRPALADSRVRQAIAMAIDRTEIVRAIRGGRPSASLWAAVFPFGSSEVPASDPTDADRLLDDAGWRRGGDGVRTRDGNRLALSLWAYPQRPDLVTMQPVLRAQLAAIGIAVETRVTEQAAAFARAGDFDLLLWAQHTAPAGDPAFFPAAFLASDGANNHAGWRDGEMDRLVADLRVASDAKDRVAIARTIDLRVRAMAPVIPLVTPEWHVGLSRRLGSYEPWGSDYYVVRAEMGGTR